MQIWLCCLPTCFQVWVKSLSRVWLFATPWTVAYQAPPSMEFFRQDSGMGFHFLLQGIFPTQGSNPGLPHCRQTLYHLSHQRSPFSGLLSYNLTTITLCPFKTPCVFQTKFRLLNLIWDPLIWLLLSCVDPYIFMTMCIHPLSTGLP